MIQPPIALASAGRPPASGSRRLASATGERARPAISKAGIAAAQAPGSPSGRNLTLRTCAERPRRVDSGLSASVHQKEKSAVH